MPIPTYQDLMLPLLKQLATGKPRSYREVREAVAADLGLTREELAQRLPSGKQSTYDNRFGWAKTYLQKADLVMSPQRGVVQITELGRGALNNGVTTISKQYLMQFPSFQAFLDQGDQSEARPPVPADTEVTPDESIEQNFTQLRQETEAQLLDLIGRSSPAFFEQLVVDLLLKMGYGGSLEDAGKAIGRSSDGGIDGIIKEDKLGLDAIYIQAKRWQGTVGRPEIHRFAGSLHGVRARKGVFITTSRFTSEATEYVASIDLKIVLIDGKTLARLMFEHGLGVTTYKTFELKRIDSDYFSEV
jgi:restriction system protein